ncbi:MAG: PmoA family protein [Planctomycetales bacterium]|nr:PmoA family protein [Planctomycetales bacterium]
MTATLALMLGAWASCQHSAAADFSIDIRDDRIRIEHDGRPVAEYVFRDPVITRPYFANLCSPTGLRLTRNHPPINGQDRMDHPEYHPGLWLAFGDLSGSDNWRLKAPVQHERFVNEPSINDGRVRFTVQNRYQDDHGESTRCREVTDYTLRETTCGMLLTWDTTFSNDKPFWFGDQEEMGLGLRLATPLRVEQGGPDPAPAGTGEIIDNRGRKNAEQIWGNPCQWIDYRGELGAQPAGVALFCHPTNFRESRMHARDYGFVCANPFALAAFNAGQPSRVEVSPGETLRLRYGVLLHSGKALTPGELEQAYDDYCRRASP